MTNDVTRPLVVNVSENLRITDVGSPEKPLHAVVAVLDALGAADYSKDQVDKFLKNEHGFSTRYRSYSQRI
jgi:hypothetical protein